MSDRVRDNTRRRSTCGSACPYPVHPRRPLLVHPVPVERDSIVDEGVNHMDNNGVSLVDDNWRPGNLPVHGWAGAVEAVCVKEIDTGRDLLLLAAVSRVGGAVPGGRVWLSKRWLAVRGVGCTPRHRGGCESDAAEGMDTRKGMDTHVPVVVTQVAIRTTEVRSVVRFAVPPEVTAAYFDSAVLAIHHGKAIDHCGGAVVGGTRVARCGV